MITVGDRYTWRSITIVVASIDPEGKWALIHCTIEREASSLNKAWTQEWNKQQPTPEGKFPADWIKL